MTLLKQGGKAGIVLPDGSLFGEGVVARIKEKLLEECNLHTIIRLPPGVFQPYAGVNTNLVFFTKGQSTKEVWYYQMPLPAGLKQYTKNRGITDAEFEPIAKWFQNKKASDNAWKVSIKEIQERNYNLDFKNPKGAEEEDELSSEDLVKKILGTEEEIKGILKNI
jgi:type I restriction enzyme M protein